MTRDMGHVTRDMWQVTCDLWHELGDEHSLKFQLPNSYGLGKKIIWRSGGKEWLAELIKEWMNKLMTKLFFRTAPATQGLLTSKIHHFFRCLDNVFF